MADLTPPCFEAYLYKYQCCYQTVINPSIKVGMQLILIHLLFADHSCYNNSKIKRKGRYRTNLLYWVRDQTTRRWCLWQNRPPDKYIGNSLYQYLWQIFYKVATIGDKKERKEMFTSCNHLKAAANCISLFQNHGSSSL